MLYKDEDKEDDKEDNVDGDKEESKDDKPKIPDKNINIDFTEKEPPVLDGFDTKKELKILKSGKRHVVKINDIGLEKNTYSKTNTIKTKNLIADDEIVKAIAVFVNEYIPEHFPDKDYIKYTFVINGESIPVVPINSQRNGIKIIKASQLFEDTHYSKYISEKINSAYLIITIETPSDIETPFIANLKILKSEDK